MVVVQGQDNDKFTYHLVNIKLKFGGFAMIYFYSFTYHLVNIKLDTSINDIQGEIKIYIPLS